jgi:hypothetical protein
MNIKESMPELAKPVVTVYRRWDADVDGLPVTIVRQKLQLDIGSYAAYLHFGTDKAIRVASGHSRFSGVKAYLKSHLWKFKNNDYANTAEGAQEKEVKRLPGKTRP